MTTLEFLQWFTPLFGMIGGGALIIYMLYGICHVGEDKKKETAQK